MLQLLDLRPIFISFILLPVKCCSKFYSAEPVKILFFYVKAKGAACPLSKGQSYPASYLLNMAEFH